jgi:hypothetical protein
LLLIAWYETEISCGMWGVLRTWSTSSNLRAKPAAPAKPTFYAFRTPRNGINCRVRYEIWKHRMTGSHRVELRKEMIYPVPSVSPVVRVFFRFSASNC